jgi:hypothetical protein
MRACVTILDRIQRLPPLLAGMAVVSEVSLCTPDPAFAAARRATASENLPDAGLLARRARRPMGARRKSWFVVVFPPRRSPILLIGGKNRIYALALPAHRHSPIIFHDPASTASTALTASSVADNRHRHRLRVLLVPWPIAVCIAPEPDRLNA